VQQTRPDVIDPAEFNDRFGFTPIEDRQLEAAMDVLKGIKLLDGQAERVAAH
jgi:carboxyl-terminal processing protease